MRPGVSPIAKFGFSHLQHVARSKGLVALQTWHWVSNGLGAPAERTGYRDRKLPARVCMSMSGSPSKTLVPLVIVGENKETLHLLSAV